MQMLFSASNYVQVPTVCADRTRTCCSLMPDAARQRGWYWRLRAGTKMDCRPEMRDCSLKRKKHFARLTSELEELGYVVNLQGASSCHVLN